MSVAAHPSLNGITPTTSLVETDLAGRLRLATDEPGLVKFAITFTSLVFLTVVLFVPLAAIYFFSALLLMILPMRWAAFVFYNATEAVFWTVVALFATIVGVLVARAAFGQTSVLWALADWRFIFPLAVAGCHFFINELGRNTLLRVLGFAVFLAATLACLFWTFRF